jgi:Ser/Thr protein kinase RdoA (MazF antagonist)
MTQFPQRRDERLILREMGRETANLHLATSDQRKTVLRDLTQRGPDWLLKAAQAMAKATEQDWESFRTSQLATRS